MKSRNIIWCFLALHFHVSAAIENDSPPSDTIKFYKNLSHFSQKSKFGRFIYNSVFVTEDEDSTLRSKDLSDKQLQRFSGKVIRHLHVQSLDPFGYDLRDSTAKPKSWIPKAGNTLHIKSSVFAIKNQMLVHEGESLDIGKLKESERLIRQSVYLKDVVVDIRRAGKDSVDISFIVQDVWSISGGIVMVDSIRKFLIRDRNFLGLSHELDNYIVTNGPDRKTVLEGSYTVPYISHTFITASIFFSTSNQNYTKGIRVSRLFYSPLTKWAGGVDYLFHSTSDSVNLDESIPVPYLIKYNNFDAWGAKAFTLLGSNSADTSMVNKTNLIISSRYLKTNYTARVPSANDTDVSGHDTELYLFSIGLTNRSYYRDYYVYRYGVAEDVPAGKKIQALVGFENSLLKTRLYTALIAGYGNHIDGVGYASIIGGYGTYFNNGHTEQTTVNATAGYFTDLIKFERWNFRQFAKLQMVYGAERPSGEVIDINNDHGIKGFDSSTLFGTKKIVFSLQSQFYLPYNWLGFRFAPFIFGSVALIGKQNDVLLHQRLYQAIGIGVLVRNEFLVINTFQFAFGYYPYIPSQGYSLLRFDPVRTFDFTFQDFDIEKPVTVPFE